MNQGSLKSAVRRSLTKSLLLPPDDGNEAVQSRATGKPKTKAAAGFMSRRTSRGQDSPTPSRGKEEEMKAMADRNSNDFQLLQVSREAHKLAKMIDSWSTAANIDNRSQFFAEDLLRGALDLQESLDMLKKLQDATKNALQVNRKLKQEAIGGRHEKFSAQEVIGNYRDRLHEPRFSSDDSSRSSVEELKQVIQESLYKQNMLSSSSDDGKCSSSRSMRYGTSNFFDDRCLQNPVPVRSICSNDQPKKVRSSTLIAKLMGLEEVSPKIVQPIKKVEKDCLNQPKPRFDIERPKARKTQLIVENNDQKQNRLLKPIQVEEKGFGVPFFSATELEQFGGNVHEFDYSPPIVIMKPIRLLNQENNVHKDLPRDKVSMPDIQECRLVQENNSCDCHRQVSAKSPEKKELRHVEEDTIESFPNYHISSSMHHQRQRGKVIVAHKMKTEEQKPSRFNVKKQEERGVKAARMVMNSHKSTTEQAKTNKEVPKSRTIVSTPHNRDVKSHFRPLPKEITDSTKDKNKSGVKPNRRSSIVEALIAGKRCDENGTTTRPKKMNDVPKVTGSLNDDNLVEPVEQQAKYWNRDNVNGDHKIFFEDRRPRVDQHEGSCKLVVVQLPDCKKVNGAVARKGEGLNNIFMSSQSFLSCAKRFFGLDATPPMRNQREVSDEIRKLNTKLILDVSEELMAQKYQQKKIVIYPLMQGQPWSRLTYSSIDKLVEEISVGITKLTSYSKIDSISVGITKLTSYSKIDSLNTSEGILYMKLEKDLMCKDAALSSAWDHGWDQCLEEAVQVVEEVGEQILSRLIEEAALKFI